MNIEITRLKELAPEVTAEQLNIVTQYVDYMRRRVVLQERQLAAKKDEVVRLLKERRYTASQANTLLASFGISLEESRKVLDSLLKHPPQNIT